MDINYLIRHPEQLDRETLYELRSLLALHPYFQTARLLMLQNLFLLHDPTFDEELRRAAIYITDRRTIFQLVEATHYQIARKPADTPTADTPQEGDSRTITLIDTFLESIPQEASSDTPQEHRRPTAADATVDYVAYLLQSERYEEEDNAHPQMRHQELIDDFIENDHGRIVLSDTDDGTPPSLSDTDDDTSETNYCTETFARIYIKQHQYEKALEIIRQLSLNYPKKNAYFADQIRFLEKLIINNNKNK